MAETKCLLRLPEFQSPAQNTFLRFAFLLSMVLIGLALVQFREQFTLEELIFTSFNFRAALNVGYLVFFLIIVASALSFTPRRERMEISIQRFLAPIGQPKSMVPLILAALLSIYLFLTLGFYGRFFINLFPRLLLFWTTVLTSTLLLSAWKKYSWWRALAISTLSLAALHNAALFFQQVSTYPLSLGWSEVSRYYQASFYFAESVYGRNLAWPITHPSRYLLQSLPFIFKELPLWVHRLWQALLWVSMAAVTSLVFAKRVSLKGTSFWMIFVAWLYLYLMQGAVFFHLLPAVFLVLWSFDSRRFKRSLLFVLLASIWAGISRINWLPMPAALAAMLYLIETPLQDSKKPLSIKYWTSPAAYFLLGSLTALASYAVYIQNSRNRDIGQFTSSFSSTLLWERLWPSAAFPPGILPGVLLVSLPLFWLIFLHIRTRKANLHYLRWVAITLILLLFFIGGLIVSVKIGGGTNLHNMDAFMLLLAVLTVQITLGRFLPDQATQSVSPISIPWRLSALLITIPLLFAITMGGPLQLADSQQTDAALEKIQQEVQRSLEDGTEVLFISQRHLITFGLIDAPLVHEYEKLFLMEMAISHNDDYLFHFAKDIDEQRFGLIVTDPLHRHIRDADEDNLAPENNEWVRFVSRPILCAYSPINDLSSLTLQLLEPRYGSKCDQ